MHDCENYNKRHALLPGDLLHDFCKPVECCFYRNWKTDSNDFTFSTIFEGRW